VPALLSLFLHAVNAIAKDNRTAATKINFFMINIFNEGNKSLPWCFELLNIANDEKA
jgi:hypothetical protein